MLPLIPVLLFPFLSLSLLVDTSCFYPPWFIFFVRGRGIKLFPCFIEVILIRAYEVMAAPVPFQYDRITPKSFRDDATSDVWGPQRRDWYTPDTLQGWFGLAWQPMYYRGFQGHVPEACVVNGYVEIRRWSYPLIVDYPRRLDLIYHLTNLHCRG